MDNQRCIDWREVISVPKTEVTVGNKTYLVDEVHRVKSLPNAKVYVIYADDQSEEAKEAGRKRISEACRRAMQMPGFGEGTPL